MNNSGRAYPDYKAQSSVGNTPYTNKFVISGVMSNLKREYKLFSPIDDIAELPHGQLTSAQKVYVASTSNRDDITGTGARLVILNGLDTYGNIQDELVLMDGKTPVESANDYISIAEVLIYEYGSNIDTDTGDSVSVGDIYVGTGTWNDGVPSNPITGIKQSENNASSREAIFQVPAGKLLLVRSLFATTEPDKKENTSLIVQLAVLLPVFGSNTLWIKSEPYAFDSTFQYLPEFLLPIPPLSKIQIRGKTTINKTKRSTVSLGCELRDIRV